MLKRVKDWLQHSHISYRNLADEMNQSVSGICKKTNSKTYGPSTICPD